MMNVADTTLALAGIFQSAELVRQVARKGIVEHSAFDSSIKSVLKIDASSTEDVYGGLQGVKLGLQILVAQLGSQSRVNDRELMRYVLGILFLERKLIKKQEMLQTVQQGVQQAQRLAETSHTTDPEVVALLANLYSETISTFQHRIQVSGEQRHLENPLNANKIRSLLLSGIRSAVLWRQKGGNRWQLLFSRKKILQFAKDSLERIRKMEQFG
ncbi:high frequency lysogenization protein HflD [Beggiatoa leptomitoformis]|uniref:High frequency lysogenization protein HflD homolog n=1 Tax=Beggiatoa leptomitoformis TaxID=288004 RepID=A0A2N9YET4_9GAMM|nr:high frequency lysogenization protein HflD [Beggiatoa leptomitoformis]ALG68781.1 high frequency lysogenization protein HflD [Beggiatoa leptomitoformis]AUI68859.1 high frequency lysogenization protein HflD [Beggiatoa leptomitoformis]